MGSISDETPLLGGSRKSTIDSSLASAAGESHGYTTADFLMNLRDVSIGLVNSILTIPCMVGYAAIIFANEAFRPFIPMLAKIILFSAVVHQIVFCLLSTMPFAIGQVQDAGLIFLAAIATSIAHKVGSMYTHLDFSALHSVTPSTDVSTIDPSLYEYAATVTSTAVVCIGLCTATLGLCLVWMGKARLAKFVSYLPMSVISGYLAFIGLFCIQAGFSLSTGLSISSPGQWGQLWEKDHIIHLLPGIFSGIFLSIVSRKFKHPLALPLAMLSMLAVFFLILTVTGTSILDARADGWVSEAAPSVGALDVFALFDFGKVQWWTMPYQIPQWIAMTFVVAFSSCLDVAAIEIDLGRSLDMNHELAMVGYSNFISGIFGGYTGSYIFSQTIFTCRTGSLSRIVGWVVAISELIVFILPTDILAYIPRFFFAATLIFIGIDLCYEWLVEVVVKKKVSLHEHSVSMVTFFAMIVTNIEMGLVIGILAAVLHFIVRYVQFSKTYIHYTRSSQALPLLIQKKLTHMMEWERNIKTVELSGYVFFGSSLSLLDEVKKTLFIAVTPQSHSDNGKGTSQSTGKGTYVMSVYELEELTRLHGKRDHPPETTIPVSTQSTMITSHFSTPEKPISVNSKFVDNSISNVVNRRVSYGSTDAVPLIAGMGASIPSESTDISGTLKNSGIYPTDIHLSSSSYQSNANGPLHTAFHPIPVDMYENERKALHLETQVSMGDHSHGTSTGDSCATASVNAATHSANDLTSDNAMITLIGTHQPLSPHVLRSLAHLPHTVTDAVTPSVDQADFPPSLPSSSSLALSASGNYPNSTTQTLYRLPLPHFTTHTPSTSASASITDNGPQSPSSLLFHVLPSPSHLPLARVPTQAIIIDCSRVIGIDSTALRSCFMILSHIARSHHCDLVYAGIGSDVVELMIANNVICLPSRTVQDDLDMLKNRNVDVLKGNSDVHRDGDLASASTPAAASSILVYPSDDTAISIPTIDGFSIYALFDLEPDMPSVTAAWGCVCTSTSVDAALRWSEARMLAKRDCE